MNKLILIVEDDEMCRNQVVEALEEDYLLLCAGDAKTALMELEKRAKEIAVVILDLSLPDQDAHTPIPLQHASDDPRTNQCRQHQGS